MKQIPPFFLLVRYTDVILPNLVLQSSARGLLYSSFYNNSNTVKKKTKPITKNYGRQYNKVFWGDRGLGDRVQGFKLK